MLKLRKAPAGVRIEADEQPREAQIEEMPIFWKGLAAPAGPVREADPNAHDGAKQSLNTTLG
jgi:hypothetical protein